MRQVVNPVLWEDSMRRVLADYGVEKCYEIGPGRVLTGLLKRIDRKIPVRQHRGLNSNLQMTQRQR